MTTPAQRSHHCPSALGVLSLFAVAVVSAAVLAVGGCASGPGDRAPAGQGSEAAPLRDSRSERIDATGNVRSGPPGVELDIYAFQTIRGVGAIQGAATRDGLVYLFGDLYGGPEDASNRGIIREYRVRPEARDLRRASGLLPSLEFTGREVRLTHGGAEVAGHPTGLTFHPLHGCFLGNTVNKVGTILHIDWDAALDAGTLDGAVLNATLDDAATNGTRPEFVEINGTWYIATSDYGPDGNALRLMNPDLLATAERTSVPGVVVTTAPCGAFVQSLRHLDATDELVLVQNITAGKDYRLTFLPLASVLAGEDLRLATPIDLVYPSGTELEGFLPLDRWLSPRDVLLLDAYSTDNAHFGRLSRPATN